MADDLDLETSDISFRGFSVEYKFLPMVNGGRSSALRAAIPATA